MVDHQSVRRFYDRWAGPYDLLADAPIVRGWRRRAVERLALQPGDVVVEMGCGTGANLSLLRDRVGSSGQVIGLDLSGGMLARARDRVRRHGWGNVALVRADVTRPPFASDVDAILASFVVGMFDAPAALVETWMDVLGPGGRIGLLDAAPSDWPAVAPLNLCFRAFTRLTAPSSRTATASPAVTLDRRVRTAHDHVAARADTETETTGFGYVRVTGGRVS